MPAAQWARPARGGHHCYSGPQGLYISIQGHCKGSLFVTLPAVTPCAGLPLHIAWMCKVANHLEHHHYQCAVCLPCISAKIEHK